MINPFPPHIDKVAIQELPLTHFEGEVIVIDKPEQVAEAVAYLNQFSVLGVDTEARPSFKRGVHYPTALVQIATEERCYLFRLTHVGLPVEITQIFANPSICKVGLAFKDDINGLRRRRDFKPANCVDLQSIVCKYGIMDLGLQKTKPLSKKEVETLKQAEREAQILRQQEALARKAQTQSTNTPL